MNIVGQASKLNKDDLPDNTKAFIHLDFDALRKSKLGSTLINWAQKEDGGKEKMDEIEKDIGFDLLTAINGVTISTNGKKDYGMVILKHTANIKKVLSYIKKADGYYATKYKTSGGKGSETYIHSVGKKRTNLKEKPDDRGYISFVDKNTAVIAPSRKLTGQGIELVKGNRSTLSLPVELSIGIGKVKLPLISSYVDIDALGDVIEDDNIKDMVRDSMFFLGETDGRLIMNLKITAQSVETAEHMYNMANGLLGIASLKMKNAPEKMSLIKAMKISKKQSAIIASFSMSVDKILEYADPELKEFNINLGDNLNKR